MVPAPYQRIAVALDFSEPSRRALSHAIEVAQAMHADLFLVHVVEPFVPPYPVALVPEPGTLEGAAKRELDAEVARVRPVLPTVRGVVLVGSPVTKLTAWARENDIDLLIAGTHGRRGMSRGLLGSVAEKIVRLSQIPVLTVHGDAQP